MVDVEGLQHFVFRRDDLVLVVPRGHALARRRRVVLAEVVDCRFVGLAEGSRCSTTSPCTPAGSASGWPTGCGCAASRPSAGMVEQGIGVGIVPKAAADRSPSLPRIRAIPIAEAWAARHLLACVRDADALPLPARRMLQHLLAPAPQ